MEKILKFEIGKYYKHTSGMCFAIRGQLKTTMWGDTLVAECSKDILGLRPVDNTEVAARNFIEIDEKEWYAQFNDVNREADELDEK